MTDKKLLSISIVIIMLFNSISFAQVNSNDKEWEIFPILNYDTDTGIGYGIKGFFYNYFNKGESLDLTIYQSTKGERWYQLVYSSPDIQRRHGKKFDFAFDLIIDYDKWIDYLYYWDSNNEVYLNSADSQYNVTDKEKYTREPIEIKGIISRAPTSYLIFELGLAYKSISCYNFEVKGNLQNLKPQNLQHAAMIFNFRVDTRSNIINPTNGLVLEINNEYGVGLLKKAANYFNISVLFQSYLEIILPKIIVASRLKLNTITDVPYQNLLSIGGNNSVRGLPQDRYLSNSYILINEEIRFPLWWRFSGIVGADLANSDQTPKWIINPVFGLRFNMDNFIVRADLGIGSESTGFYFNFGHLF